MAGNFGGYWDQQVLKHIAGQTAWTNQTYFMCLFTGNPLTAASNINGECVTPTVDGGYTRMAIGTGAFWDTVGAPATASASVANTASLTFPAAATSWGTISYLVISNTSTVNNGLVCAWCDVTTPGTVSTGVTAIIGTNSVTMSLK